MIISAPIVTLICAMTGIGWSGALVAGAIIAGMGIVDLMRRI